MSERKAELIGNLIDTCNQHVLKYQSDHATQEMVFILADVLGMYTSILDAPEEIMADIHKLIDSTRATTTDHLNVRNLVKYQ